MEEARISVLHQSLVMARLADGATVVTATRRLAREFTRQYALQQRGSGARAWLTPPVFAFQDWLQRLWREAEERALVSTDAGPLPRLLTPAQERCVWEQVLLKLTQERPLLRVTEAAANAMEAWRLTRLWRLAPAQWPADLSEDCLWFAQAAASFQQQLNELCWLDAPSLADALIEQLAALSDALPPRVVWVGFDALPPQWLDFARHLETHQCGSEWLDPGAGAAAPCAVFEFPDAQSEVFAAARWGRALLESGAAQRIGIVVPDLARRTGALQRVLAEIMEPAVLFAPAQSSSVFSLSLAPPLADYPLIRAALHIIELSRGELTFPAFSALLRSPFLGAADAEATARIVLDLRLRETGELHIRLDDVVRRLAQAVSPHCAVLASNLAAYADTAREMPTRCALREWVSLWHKLLGVLGWPGAPTENAGDRQLLDAWQGLLDSFVALEPAVTACSFATAFAHLQRLARETLFQPESPAAPVQVLGELEAGGLAFDALWVMGCHDGALPTPARPHPFIPLPLQRLARIPHSTPDLALAAARTRLNQLKRAASRVVFSFAAHDDGAEQRLSPLLADIARGDVDALPQAMPNSWRAQLRVRTHMEQWQDGRAPPLRAGERVRGGTGVFRDQAACPFKAFVRCRLGAQAPAVPQFGLGAAARGTLAHEALELLWRDLSSHAALCSLDEAALRERVARSVRAAVQRFAASRPYTFTASFVAMEEARLQTLLLQWLEVERQREPFTVVASEQQRTIALGGVTIRAKIDRVDRLRSGGFAVIDYKTHAPSLNVWFGRRPDDPQVPLYGLSLPEPAVALMFGNLASGALALQGLAERDGVAPGVQPLSDTKWSSPEGGTWQRQLEEWRADLQKLAEDFAAGIALVDPRDGAKTCLQCDLHAVCRVAERDEGTEVTSDE